MLDKKYLFLFLLLSNVLLGGALGTLLLGEYYAKKIYPLRDTPQTSELQSFAGKALKFNYNIDHTATPIQYYKGEAYNLEGNQIEALKSFIKAEQLNPYHLMTLHNIGLLYHLAGDSTMAYKYWNKVFDISENFEQSLVVLSFINYRKQRLNEAMCYLSKIPTDSKHPHYDYLIDMVMRDYVLHFVNKLNQLSINEKLTEISEDKEWKKKIIADSRKQDSELSERLLMDAIYILDDITPEDSLKVIQGHKYHNEYYYICNSRD